MRVLVAWPPQVPSYFNAGHHLAVFLTAAYLRAQPGVRHVDAVDFGTLSHTWKEIGETFFQGQYDLVVVVNDFDNVDDVPRLVRYARILGGPTRVITGGRLSRQAPQAFRELDVDAVVESGDLEAGVAEYAAALLDGRNVSVPGVAVRGPTAWVKAAPGIVLDPDQWCLPDVGDIPYPAYDRMYRRDQNKFCGIPGRRELVVPVARGCPINCSFCDVPSVQGLRDRRLPVQRAVEYIRAAFTREPFEYVAFYAPTFTLNRRWTLSLCEALGQQPRTYPWKCATTIAHLDDELLIRMAAAGCVRVSVGVETMEDDGLDGIPRIKRFTVQQLRDLATACDRLGVELNCFVVVGLPGTTVTGTRRTIEAIRSVGARVRPTMYADIARLRAATTLAETSSFNRQLLSSADVTSGVDASDFHALLFGREDWVTSVAERIPRRHAGVQPR